MRRRIGSHEGGTSLRFNSRTREGCDNSLSSLTSLIAMCFNSRTREGCDGEARGYGRRYTARFNSRTREGCDVRALLVSLGDFVFQFTHPGGVRPQGWVATAPASAFQFTHPGGVRLAAHEVLRECSRVSIHAPGRGATHYDLPYPAERYGFNSRTREGCDNQLLILNGVRDGFQFTHPGGVRPYPPPY